IRKKSLRSRPNPKRYPSNIGNPPSRRITGGRVSLAALGKFIRILGRVLYSSLYSGWEALLELCNQYFLYEQIVAEKRPFLKKVCQLKDAPWPLDFSQAPTKPRAG